MKRMKKKVRVWMTEDAYKTCKSEAALAGMPFYQYLDKKLKTEADREEATLRRRYYPKF